MPSSVYTRPSPACAEPAADNLPHLQYTGWICRSQGTPFNRGLSRRQRKRENAPMTDPALNGQFLVMQFDQAFTDRQPQPGSFGTLRAHPGGPNLFKFI